MGKRADQIENHIHRTREDLSDNFSELEEKVKSTFDWRTQFEERPMTMLAVAFGGGMLLSAILPTRRSRSRHYYKERGTDRIAAANAKNNARRDFSAIPTSAEPTNGRAKRPSESFDAIKGALVGVAANRLGGFFGDLLSNYREELHHARKHRRQNENPGPYSGSDNPQSGKYKMATA